MQHQIDHVLDYAVLEFLVPVFFCYLTIDFRIPSASCSS